MQKPKPFLSYTNEGFFFITNTFKTTKQMDQGNKRKLIHWLLKILTRISSSEFGKTKLQTNFAVIPKVQTNKRVKTIQKNKTLNNHLYIFIYITTET